MGVTCTRSVRYLVQGEQGAKGDRGAVLRGPQDWNGVEAGYSFEAGGEGDTFLDCVMYNSYYYLCKKSHTKTSDNYPGSTSDVNNGWWQLGDTVSLVATTLLLSQYSLIKNLDVDALEMYDSDGNVVAYMKDGEIRITTGTFENVTVSGVLNGVTGTFKSLQSPSGENGISLAESQVTINCCDLYHQGTYNGRSLRFYTNDVWCRGTFGAAERSVVAIDGNKAYYYNDRQSNTPVEVTMTGASYNGVNYYIVNCYGQSGEVAGFPVDTVAFLEGSDGYTYHLSMHESQRVNLVNVCNYGVQPAVYSAGGSATLAGGCVRTAQRLLSLQSPAQSSSIPGAGIFLGPVYSNSWTA